MALADILKRIEDDAEAEARAAVEEARAKGEDMVARAREEAAGVSDGIVEEAESRARRDRETTLANARLSARDRILGAKQELAGRVLRQVEDALAALPDDEYASMLGERVAAAARGGERVLVAGADRDRLAGRLEAAVASALGAAGRDVDLSYPDEAAGLARGVLLSGERMSVEISPRSLVNERRGDLLGRVSAALFGEGGE